MRLRHGFGGVSALDARHLPAKRGELFLKFLHFASYSPTIMRTGGKFQGVRTAANARPGWSVHQGRGILKLLYSEL